MIRFNRKSVLSLTSPMILGVLVVAGSLVETPIASAQFKPLVPGPIYNIAPPVPVKKRVITGTIHWTLDPKVPSNSATARRGLYVGGLSFQRSDVANAPIIPLTTDARGNFKYNLPVGPYFVRIKGYSSPVIMVQMTGGSNYTIQVIKFGKGS